MPDSASYSLEQVEDDLATLRGEVDKLDEVYDAGGNAVQVNGYWVATDPVNGGPETWHPIGAGANGWTITTGAYKLVPFNAVAVQIVATPGTTTNNTQINNVNLPGAYQPAGGGLQHLACWTDVQGVQQPSIRLGTAGGLFAYGIAGTATQIRFTGIYFLDSQV